MELNNLFFSSNIIVFDEYTLIPQKDFINPEVISSFQNINFIDFFEDNKIEKYNKFMRREIIQFPIIRIFGTTILGQKSCINIHGYYPYFFIEINESNYFNYKDENILRKFAYLLENSYIKYSFDLIEKESEYYKKNQNITIKKKKSKEI